VAPPPSLPPRHAVDTEHHQQQHEETEQVHVHNEGDHAHSVDAPHAAAKQQQQQPPKKKKGFFSKISDLIGGNEVPEDFVISDPRAFRHESHIGWDPEHGFEIRNIPPEWRKLFQAAGVKKSELKDAETAKFVMNVVASTIAGEPPPPREPVQAPTPVQASVVAPPPPPPVIRHEKSALPPPPPLVKGPPPPAVHKTEHAPVTPRNDLLKSIQQGKELKKVSAAALPDIKNLSSGQSNNLVGTLASAMAARRGAMRDDEEEDPVNEEEEWSD